MRAIFAILLVCLLATSMAKAADAPQPDADELAIDAGRLVVMVDESEEALKLLAPSLKIEDSGPGPVQMGSVFPRLVFAVGRYSVVVAGACRATRVDPRFCMGAFAPGWLKDPPDTDHDDAALRSMIEDATSHVEPFWSDICARAKRASGDEGFCQLE